MKSSEQERILRRIRRDNYYMPHPWDTWLKNQEPERPSPPHVKNIDGNDVGPRSIYRGNSSWNTKAFTSTCETCPLYIPKVEADKVTQYLQARGESWMPKQQEGLCGYRSYRLKYVLPVSSPRSCAISEDKREAAIKEQNRLIEIHKVVNEK